eukprot:gnl/TRDRNA2_/TRDRNA2_159029_c1_seq2.p1 gnl/TRDRNA2_/TRDRNA2_159029_c1~~gnl/TRDRNA2_/TRDRNA2_159029_c1_seq2.p1  ORF type:complete len:677 (-),score=121.22 gnl/TRDRNA2_/TRDRNA2_159029_c1_seq2:281-2017(-)
MAGWISAFLREAPAGLSSRNVRAFTVASLPVQFLLFATIYLLAATGSIDSQTEQLSYTLATFASKVGMSCLYVFIETAEYQKTQALTLSKIGGLNTALLSVLRSCFDFVVPCTGEASGKCELFEMLSGDMGELARCLGRSIAGVTLNELLAGEAEQARFAAYVQNVMRQAGYTSPPKATATTAAPKKLKAEGDTSSAEQSASWRWFNTDSQPPPQVVQVLNCKMLRNAARGDVHAIGGFEDQRGSDATTEDISVVIYLTPVQPAAPNDEQGNVQQMVAAVRLAPTEYAHVPPVACEGVKLAKESAHASDAGCDVPSSTASLLDSVDSRKMTSSVSSEVATVDNSSFDTQSHPCPPGTRLSINMLQRKATTTKKSKMAKKDRRGEKRSERGDCSSVSRMSSAASASVLGGSDVGSQASKETFVGSVHFACRQLLGSLLERPPPKQLMSKSMDDHVQCAKEMVQLKAPVEIHRLHHKQQLSQWHERFGKHVVSEMLRRGRAPDIDGIDENIWRSGVLPALGEDHPGMKPHTPILPNDDDLWFEAWRIAYEGHASSGSGEEDSDEEERSAARIQRMRNAHR